MLVFDLSAEAVQNTQAAGTTGKAATDVNELAGADVLFTCLPLPSDVEKVMLGDRGLLGRMRKGYKVNGGPAVTRAFKGLEA